MRTPLQALVKGGQSVVFETEWAERHDSDAGQLAIPEHSQDEIAQWHAPMRQDRAKSDAPGPAGVLPGVDSLDDRLSEDASGSDEATHSSEHASEHSAAPGESEAAEGRLDAYRPGSDADFSRLYEREALSLTRTVYAIVGNRQEAEDCVQEAFVRAYKKWSSWLPTAPARFWVQRIAINLAISRRRSDRLAAIRNKVLARTVPASRRAGDNLDLLTALRKLPVKQLTAVLLRFNHGYNNREIAQTLGISERAVGLRVQAGLDGLKVLLDGTVTA